MHLTSTSGSVTQSPSRTITTSASIIFHSPETKRVDPAIPFVVVVDDPTDLLAPFTSLVTQEDPFDFSFSRTSNSPL